MRVCFLNHNLQPSSGAGRFGLALIERMSKSVPALRVTVLTAVGCGHINEEPILYQSSIRLLMALPRIRRAFRKSDIIHALDGYPYGVIAAIASLGLGKKLIITAIGTGAIQAFSNPIMGRLLRWAYRRADKVVAISNYTRREITSRVPDLHIEVINHAVDSADFQKNSASELNAEEAALIESLKPYIISVGSWKKRKGFEYSIPAFAEAAGRFPKLKYVIVGAGKKHFMNLADFLGVGGRVLQLKGVRWPFLVALYRNAELFMLLPYNDRGDVEGFGFAFLEAAAAGLPVVGTRESGGEDAIRDGENGYLIEPGDSRGAALAAVKILSDDSLRKKFSSSSIEFAKQMNWENVIRKYSAIYRELFP